MRRLAAVLPLLLLVSCSRQRTAPPARPAAPAEATFFDVGQGDAALLRTPEHYTVVIDTGHNGGTAALLRQAGVRRIDLLIVSHPHLDHAGGLAAIARAFPVAETWYAGDYRGRLARALAAAGNARPVAAGERKQLGALSLEVLHPEPGARFERTEAGINNGSLVVRAVYRDTAYLFPGDCELDCWQQLFQLHRADLRADILKAAHHGSWNGTNSGVLLNVRPADFIISCGRGNEYGHPHPVVIALAQKARVNLFRTDEQGTIQCQGKNCTAANGHQ